MKIMKLLRQKSSTLPELKFKNIIKYDENLKATKLSFKTKIKLIKDKPDLEESNKIFINQEKSKIYNQDIDYNSKIMISNNNKKNNLKELKEEIEYLKSQLSEEKLKSEVLKQIAEEEQKKHLLYKKKFQKIILSNGELIDETKSKNNNNRIISYTEDKKKGNNNNIAPIKYINSCNSVRNLNSYSKNKSYINSFLLSPRQFCLSPSPIKTIPVNKFEIIKGVIVNKKIKFKKKENNIELKEKINQKEMLIEKLSNKIKILNEENLRLLNNNKKNIEENRRLKKELDLKNKEIEEIKLKLNEELFINQKNLNKLKEIKDLNEKFLNKLIIEREKNQKLKLFLNNNKKEDINIINGENIILNDNKKNSITNKNKLEKSLEKTTKRSLEINGLKDISNISCIEVKQQMGQYEPEDTTLKEIFQKKLFDLDETHDNNNGNK